MERHDFLRTDVKSLHMKKTLLMIGFLATMALGCDNRKNDGDVPPPEEPTPAPAPAPEEREDGTTLKINEEGVSYENKKGDDESNIQISTDTTNIEIKDR